MRKRFCIFIVLGVTQKYMCIYLSKHRMDALYLSYTSRNLMVEKKSKIQTM